MALKTETAVADASGYPLSCPIDSRTLKWEFKCRVCRTSFTVEVPKGPKEEQAIHCDICGSALIERINIPDLEAAGCSG